MTRNISEREMQIADLISHGKTSKDISAELGVSANTIEHHKKILMLKTDSRNIAELTRWYLTK